MAAASPWAIGIHPEGLYPLRGFREATGISETRMRLARREGVELATVNVGRRKLVRGRDAIEYVERLAATHGP